MLDVNPALRFHSTHSASFSAIAVRIFLSSLHIYGGSENEGTIENDGGVLGRGRAPAGPRRLQELAATD